MTANREPIEIISPPFPDDSVTVDELYDMLGALASFVEFYRSDVNRQDPNGCQIAKPRGLLSLELHRKLPVTRIARSYSQMRELRAAWDLLVRTFEHSWTCSKAHKWRHGFFHQAAWVVDTAHLNNEAMELKYEQACQHEQQVCLGSMAQFFQELHRRISDPPEEDDPNNPIDDE